MIDEVFIKTILQKGKEAKEKVHSEFSNISLQQLNWKPSAESWSIAQCLEHLAISHSTYFPALKKITEGVYKMSFWERYSPFSGICGRLLKDQLQEQPKKKFQAPKIIRPSGSEITIEIIEQYHHSLDRFLQYIADCRNIDIDKTIITSPAIGIVTYSLRDAFQFLIQHEHRHINQAILVKENNRSSNLTTAINPPKYPYDKILIKGKILNIKGDIEKLIKPICSERFFVDWYGAYDINPKHLVYWICVQSDKMKNRLSGNIELMTALRALLEKHDYPAESQKFVHIGFESQETVDRESKGNWYYHFK
jgi:uncharacterized damage-inducible protein DinB